METMDCTLFDEMYPRDFTSIDYFADQCESLKHDEIQNGMDEFLSQFSEEKKELPVQKDSEWWNEEIDAVDQDPVLDLDCVKRFNDFTKFCGFGEMEVETPTSQPEISSESFRFQTSEEFLEKARQKEQLEVDFSKKMEEFKQIAHEQFSNSKNGKKLDVVLEKMDNCEKNLKNVSDESFIPPPPEDVVRFFVRTLREGGEFIDCFPKDMTTKPYKYEMKVLSTVKNAQFDITNKGIDFCVDEVKTTQFSESLYEYKFFFQFVSHIRFPKSRSFQFRTLDSNGVTVGTSSDSIDIRSKRSEREYKFWAEATNKKWFKKSKNKSKKNKRRRELAWGEKDKDYKDEYEPSKKKRKV